MNLKLTRKIYTDKSTIGELEVDGTFECYTLEDVVRTFKVWGKTAIPAGKYLLALTYSPHFDKTMIEIQGVRSFTGIRIHTGNADTDTEGCVLVGRVKGVDWISNSTAAYIDLWEKIIGAFSIHEKIEITITDTQPPRIF